MLSAQPARGRSSRWSGRRRRGQERDECRARAGLRRLRADAAREHGDSLHRLGQRTDVVDTRHRQQLAHLLEAELGFTTGDHGGHALALDPPALRQHLIGDAERLHQLGREVGAADARRVGDRVAASSVRLKASTVEMSGFGAPRRTASPIADRARSTRDPATTRPCCTKRSRASAATMTTSMASPLASRASIEVAPVPIDVASVTRRCPSRRWKSAASSRYAAVNAPEVMTWRSSAARGEATTKTTATTAQARDMPRIVTGSDPFQGRGRLVWQKPPQVGRRPDDSRSGYSSRSADGIGSRAARIAGNRPPTSPISSA